MSMAHLASHFSILCAICKYCIEIKDLEKRGQGRKVPALCGHVYHSRRTLRVIKVSGSPCLIHEKTIEHLDRYLNKFT